MKKIILLVSVLFIFLVATVYAGSYTITTTPAQDEKVAEAATYAGYTNVDAYVSLRGSMEIEAAAEKIKQLRSNILAEILYQNIEANDRVILRQLADKYK